MRMRRHPHRKLPTVARRFGGSQVYPLKVAGGWQEDRGARKWMSTGMGGGEGGGFEGQTRLGRLKAACAVGIVRSGYLQQDEHMHCVARAGGRFNITL